MTKRKTRPRPPSNIDINSQNNANILGQILRVDHAGEMAAVEIYRAQRKVFANTMVQSNIDEQLAKQEQDEIVHKSTFDKLLIENKARPTIMEPLWRPLAQILGYGTALLGEKYAHSCTAAVEEIIENHYHEQEILIGDNAPQIKQIITKFKEEEIAHKDEAILMGAKDVHFHPIIDFVIKSGCKAAIKISNRI